MNKRFPITDEDLNNFIKEIKTEAIQECAELCRCLAKSATHKAKAQAFMYAEKKMRELETEDETQENHT